MYQNLHLTIKNSLLSSCPANDYRKDVSIIIVNYNTKDLTKNCIDSIFEKTSGISFEVILVDNDSKDGSVEFFSKDSRIQIIESGDNLGFGRANNLGVEHSSGKYVFFLNSDTILLNNAIKMMYDFMERHEELNIGALGSILLDFNHDRTHSYGDMPTIAQVLKQEWGDHLLKRFGKRMNRYDEGKIDPDAECFKVGYVTGADLFCSRNTIDKAGAFDPDFFMYWEETEMQYRWWKRLRLSSYILRGPEIVHLEGKSDKRRTKMSEIKKTRSEFLFFKKTAGCFPYYLFRMIMIFGRLHQFVFPMMTMNEKRELWRILWGTYNGSMKIKDEISQRNKYKV